jgi:hypothetical protein
VYIKHTDDIIELIKLLKKARTDEGREALGNIIDEIKELIDNATKCKIFDALSNIRNIGLHTGMYVRLENIPIHGEEY